MPDFTPDLAKSQVKSVYYFFGQGPGKEAFSCPFLAPFSRFSRPFLAIFLLFFRPFHIIYRRLHLALANAMQYYLIVSNIGKYTIIFHSMGEQTRFGRARWRGRARRWRGRARRWRGRARRNIQIVHNVVQYCIILHTIIYHHIMMYTIA